MRPWRIGLAAVVGLAVGGGSLAAQRAGAERGRFEVPGLDWGPDAAWRARAALVRTNRRAALARGDLAALNGNLQFLGAPPGGGPAALAVRGQFYVPVIALEFSNAPLAFPAADLENVLFAPAHPTGGAYTLKTYYEEVSRGRIQMTGRVFPKIRTDSTSGYYENNCNGIGVVNTCPDGGRRFGLMLIAALDSLSNRPGGDTVWSQFDNDGPDGLPNSGDDDGEVDFVTFLQPKLDGACSGSSGIWAHRYVIAGWNNNAKYVTKTPRRGPGGQPIPGQFLLVNNYTIQSQVGGGTGCTDNFIMPVGTVAHETGHAFGLPDLYDTDRTTSGTEGIGEWGIMGSGNYSRAYSPASFDPWSLLELGWATVDTLGATRTVTTGARALTDTVFFARLATVGEYLLIENRQAVRSDSAMLNIDSGNTGSSCRSNCRKMPGLLLWHIDEGRIAAGRGVNRVNTGPIQGVALIQADGLNQLRSAASTRNRGDAGDPFPGSAGRTRWSLNTTPAARTNVSDYAGFIVDQIAQLAGGVMTFRYLKREPSLVRSSLLGATVQVNGEFWGRFTDVIPAGDPVQLAADSLQEVLAGRTRARFAGWSIGGPRVQTITSGVKPDTIVASFQADHRVRAIAVGTGTGTITGGPGDLVAGVFVPEGTPVTITAAPAAGSIFAGWRGDTTSSAATLVLPMGRPFDVEASFIAEVSIVIADATSEILGTARLSDAQRTFLDQLGNRNGLFDLGDYLALLARSGQAVPEAVLRAVGSERLSRRTP